MCQVLKPLGKLLDGQFGLGLTLQLGQFPQHLAATQSTQHRLPRLGEIARAYKTPSYQVLIVFCNEADANGHGHSFTVSVSWFKKLYVLLQAQF